VRDDLIFEKMCDSIDIEQKPVIPYLTREFPDLTRATPLKNLLAHQKHRHIQTRQLTATPRQAVCRTSALTRSKEQKTHGSQNAAKASAAQR